MSYGDFLPWLQNTLNDHQELIDNRIEGKEKKTSREQLIAGITESAIEEFTLEVDEVGLSIDHEGAYKKQDDGRIDSYWFTLWSIIKITQEIKKTELA